MQRAVLRWVRRWAAALALTELAVLVTTTVLLMQSAGMTLNQVSGADFFIADSLSLMASISIVILAGSRRVPGFADLLLPACAILVGSVMTSHSMSRIEHRIPLAVVTGLHQAASAAWIGGLPYLLITLGRTRNSQDAQGFSARFSRLALTSVGILAAAGLLLAGVYVGSVGAIYGTSYGIMVTTKAILFGLLLLLGAMNFGIVRSAASGMLESLRRFGEVEIAIGFTVLLTAASLTSLPPAADLADGRLNSSTIAARMAPRVPRMSSPTTRDLPEDIYAAQQKSLEAASDSTESYVPGQAGMRPNTPAEKGWSEYNHHWAGLIVLIIGLLALAAQMGRALKGSWLPGRWARGWPLLFFLLAVFLVLRSDPETWPLGPGEFWVGMTDPEVLLHRIFAVLVVGLGIFEWRVQNGRASPQASLVFPILVGVASALLLTHSHTLGNPTDEVLAELSHAPLAILGIVAAWSRWLELRLPQENRTRLVMTQVWPVCFLLIGAVLLNYREM